MPYSSEAQRRYFKAAEKRGEISPKVVREFDKASEGLNLPERANMKKREYTKLKDLKKRYEELNEETHKKMMKAYEPKNLKKKKKKFLGEKGRLTDADVKRLK